MKTDNVRDFFKELADVIREREGSDAMILPQEMAHRVAALAGKHFEVVERTTLIGVLKDIADALRLVHGTIEAINPQDFASLITTAIGDVFVTVAEGTIELDWEGTAVTVAVESNTTWSIV